MERHPAYRPLAFLIGVALVTGSLLAVFGDGVAGPLGASVMALYAIYLSTRLRIIRALPALGRATVALELGRLDEAEKLLTDPTIAKSPATQRASLLVASTIAARRGEAVKAEAFLSSILTARERRDVNVALHRLVAFSRRAVLRAARGDETGARADLADVGKELASKLTRAGLGLLGLRTLASIRARQHLAEALLFSSANRREELRAHLEATRATMADALDARERLTLRTLERSLRAQETTPYREKPRATTGGHAAARALDAEAEAEAEALGEDPELGRARVRAGSLETVAVRALPAPSFRWARLVFALTLVGGVLGTPIFLAISLSQNGMGEAAETSVEILIMSFAAVAGIAFVTAALKLRSLYVQRAKVVSAIDALLRGDESSATTTLQVAARGEGLWAATASAWLAEDAERRADFTAAERVSQRGIERLSSWARRWVADASLAELVATRAGALAALGRAREARELVETLQPTYVGLPRARLRVGLIEKMRSGKYAEAAELVLASASDLSLRSREELLAGLALLLGAPERVGLNEQQRLERELGLESLEATWVRRIAPNALVELRARAAKRGLRVGEGCEPEPPREAELDLDALAALEAEALAEAEAEGAERPLTSRR